MMEEIWICKLIGTAVLLLASILYGRRKILEERRVIREGEALLGLTVHIAEQIEYTMKPLPEILAGFDDDILLENGFLKAASESGIREAWDNQDCKFRLPEKGMKQVFGQFCREIGRGYRKEELELCSLTIRRLREEIDQLKKDIGNREKLYRTIPPLMVMSVVLILL